MPRSYEEEAFSYTAKRLVDKPDLLAILDHNLANLDNWTSRYPNHGSWIRSTIQSIRADDYSKLAFGVFVHGGEYTGKLVCSAIVKKDHFGPYLEIKNLILLNTPLELTEEGVDRHKEICYRKLIKHIQRFAESRGYTKLVTELFNRNREDRELIQAFLGCGFDVSGSQSRRYKPTDEVIILSADVDPAYGLDPYDFESAAKWLIRRHLPEFEIQDFKDSGEGRGIEILVNGAGGFTKQCLEISSHRTGPNALQKFSSRCYVLVIESYEAANKELTDEDELDPRFGFPTHGRVYVFDFSFTQEQEKTIWERKLFPKIRQHEKNSAYFNRNELNELLYGKVPSWTTGPTKQQGRLRVTADLPFEEVGGLLTLTDPGRLDGSRIVANNTQGIRSIYIKLGPKGRFADAEQILVFYFPSEDSSSDASIWGYAEIAHVEYVNIETQRGSLSRQPPDSEVLFDYLAECQPPGYPRAEPLWDRQAFQTHNKYNATKEVVCFYLTSFVDLRSRPLRLEDVVRGEDQQSRFRRKSIVKEIDAYISLDEAQIICKHGRVARQQTTGAAPERVGPGQLPEPPYNFLCIWSSPLDEGRIEYEGNKMTEFLSGRDRYRLLDPAINVNYLGLKSALREKQPHVVHFSGHGTLEGLKFAGEVRSWTLSGAELARALEESRAPTFLVIFNCCESAALAQVISTDRFAVGFRGNLSEDHAKEFTRYYLTELVKGFDVTSLRRQLCDIARGFAYEFQGANPSVWFGGQRME